MPSAIINVMSAAAIKAGRGLLRDFGEVDKLQISRKGTSNFVTNADKRTEKTLIDELRKVRPDFGFLVEESGEIKGKDNSYRWVIDPLDGTSNFIHAIPYFCISIAVEEATSRGKEIIAGIIYDPIHNELFYAEKGKGAYLNDRRIMCSARENFDSAMLVTGNPRFTAISEETSFAMLDSASRCGSCLRYPGATALDLAYIAAGRYDAGWYPKQQLWDIASGILMIQEAGGVLSQIDGSHYLPGESTLLASNRILHPDMLKLLAASPRKN